MAETMKQWWLVLVGGVHTESKGPRHAVPCAWYKCVDTGCLGTYRGPVARGWLKFHNFNSKIEGGKEKLGHVKAQVLPG